MILSDNYKWEALLKSGEIITKGDDLTNCIKFSLIPNNILLPRHDLIGVKMIRRFGRGFIKIFSKDVTKSSLKEYLQCVVCEGFRFYMRCSNGTIMILPEDKELYL